MWLAVAATLLWGLYQVLTRLVARHDSADITTLHTPLVGLVLAGAVASLEWRTPDAFGWFWMLAGGGMGALAHICLVRALTAAPASELQPYNYFLLVFAALLGFLVYGDAPGLWTVAGAAIIVACGVIAMRRATA
jgi:drug/metabolite transporter (DMT)-like permease